MTQSKNCWLIPTDKPSRLYTNMQGILSKDELKMRLKNVNIYITNSEEIKEERCWVINSMDKIESVPHSKWGKLIIMTTDQDLIKDGVQAIDDEFLEWFVQNPSCEEVEVEEFEPIYGHQNNSSSILYKIIIPKTKDRIFSETSEETKQECFVTKCMHLDAEIAYKSLLKKETLEEAAEKYNLNTINVFGDYQSFIDGAKWQQERSYSEEEAGELVYNIMGEYAKRENIFFKGDLINNLFNKFKNK